MSGLEKDLKETLFTELNFVCYTATTVELPESMELNNLTHWYARRDTQPSFAIIGVFTYLINSSLLQRYGTGVVSEI